MGSEVLETAKLSRRSLLVGTVAAGGGLAIGFDANVLGLATAQGVGGAAEDVGLWVRLKRNNDIIVRMARSEMGQGTITGLAQLVVEELEGDWKKVRYEFIDPLESHQKKAPWGDFTTVGSRGIRNSQDYVRQGGAVAREMLKQAAAAQWKAQVSDIRCENSILTHVPTGRKLSYGQVASAAAKLPPPDPKSMTLKDRKDWKLAGKPLARLDTADKLIGKTVYTTDIKLPGMLNAAIKDAPVFRTKIRSFDDAKAKGMPGVKKVVKVGDTAVAVIADTWWHAKKAIDAVTIVYEDTPNSRLQQAAIEGGLREGLTSATGVFVGNRQGDVAKAMEGLPRKFEATYQTQYVNHATLEPMSCVALVTPDKCELWCGTQSGQGSHAAAATASGLPLDKVSVNRVMLGGGFGRRGAPQDFVTQSVLVAKEMPGVPVKMIWSREEDMTHGWYRPIGACKLSAGLDANGDLQALHIRLAAPSILATVRPEALAKDGSDPSQFQGWFPGGTESPFGYMAVPNILIEAAMRNTNVPVAFWRGVNTNQHAIFTECFIEELAKFAGKDSLEFRRKILAKNPKHLGVLNAVMEKAAELKPAAGQHRGIAVFAGYGSYIAAAADVSVSERGRAKVHRVIIGTNCGHVVNPDQVKAQIEGSVAYGLGALMHQEITIKDGAVVEKNFDTFPSLMMDEMPDVISVLVPTYDFWGGVGEPTICVTAPAVLNAIFHATGKMPRTMPLRKLKLREA